MRWWWDWDWLTLVGVVVWIGALIGGKEEPKVDRKWLNGRRKKH